MKYDYGQVLRRDGEEYKMKQREKNKTCRSTLVIFLRRVFTMELESGEELKPPFRIIIGYKAL